MSVGQDWKRNIPKPSVGLKIQSLRMCPSFTKNKQTCRVKNSPVLDQQVPEVHYLYMHWELYSSAIIHSVSLSLRSL